LPFEGVHRVWDMSLSPSGQRVAVTRYADGEWQIWICDLARGTQEKLTREGVYQSPAWHPDGNHVGYTALVNGNYDLWWSAVDASRPAEPLIAGERDEEEMQWSPDGRSVIFQAYSEETGPDLMLLRLDAPAERRSLVATPLDDSDARLSPDGRWLAYRSGDALYVSAFPGMGARTLVGRGVRTPRWSAATRELFFVKDGGLMAVRHSERGAAFEIETPQPLFETPRIPASRVGFEVAGDGKRFLFFVPLPGQVTSDEIHVKVNGFEQLQASPGEAR
jgi:dipeptidyl aminopeptidase/acylaminoacyl peptidase